MTADAEAPSSTASPTKQRRTRPSRARGLRATTGCLTCRTRRIKCDEVRPRCGRCLKADRECHYMASSNSSLQDSIDLDGDDEHLETVFDTPFHPDLTSEGNRFDLEQRPVAGVNNAEGEFGSLNHAMGSTDVQIPSVPRSHSSVQARTPSLNEISNSIAASSELLDSSENIFFDETTLSSDRPITDFETSPVSFSIALSPTTAPFHWYDLLAQDAVSNFEKHSFLNQNLDLNFNPQNLSRRQSLANAVLPFSPEQRPSRNLTSATSSTFLSESVSPSSEPWNRTEPVALNADELRYFHYYVDTVAPILDLFDPVRHFGTIVPHLALRNEGLIKSVLAVATRHMSRSEEGGGDSDTPFIPNTPKSLSHPLHEATLRIAATQYYYETLGYLSRAMQYSTYTHSLEILVTAILISTYEMIDGSSKEWERHLRGVFWIQRSQNNNGESPGLRRAVWWAWVRQDIWAAFRERRKTLTIWQPTKSLSELTPDELAIRVVFLLAKAVSYMSDTAMKSQDISKRIEEGDNLLQSLQEWYEVLPASYQPLPVPQSRSQRQVFSPIWIHPPAWAAAIQVYCFAKIIILLNKPSAGGFRSYHQRQNLLLESVRMICGLAQGPQSSELPSAFVSFQCLYAAGQCVRSLDQQNAIIDLLEKTLNTIKFPSNTLADDLRALWSSDI